MPSIPLVALDLNLLVALDRLLERENVGLAAKDLGLSQPAASRALGRLRELLGDPLLVRVGRGVVRTPRGEELRAPARAAVEAARRVFEPPARFDPATARGPFVLGLGDEAQLAFGPAIVKEIWASAPGVDVRFRALTEASAAEGRRGEIDLALAPDLSPLPRIAGAVELGDFVVRPLYRRRFVVAGAPGVFVPPLGLDEFCAADHVIVSFEAGGRGFVDDLLAAQGRRRRVAASVTGFMAAAALVARSRLLCTMPEEIVAAGQFGLVAADPPLPLPTITLSLVWQPRLSTDARHRHLRDAVARAVCSVVGERALLGGAP